MITFRLMNKRGWGRIVHAACAAAVVLAPAAAAASPTPDGAIKGLDVSAAQHAEGPINWPALAHQGIRFVGIKVSEGTYYANPYYSSDEDAARAAGLYVLPYVFANPRAASGAATAAYAIGISAYHPGTDMLPIAVDLENDPYSVKRKPGNCYGLKAPQMVAWITRFIDESITLTGTRPIIYTTADWWEECTGGSTRFRREKLWVADYGVTAPAVPQQWGRWAFWQYTDAGKLPGAGVTDLDVFQPEPSSPEHTPNAGHSQHRKKAANHHLSPKKEHSKHLSSHRWLRDC